MGGKAAVGSCEESRVKLVYGATYTDVTVSSNVRGSYRVGEMPAICGNDPKETAYVDVR